MSGDLHFAECHSSSKVLLIKGTQASGVEMLFEDSVLLAEMHGVDLVAVHEIDQGQLGDKCSIPEESAKIGLAGLGSRKCILVNGSGNG